MKFIYCFTYTGCLYECTPVTLSVHRSREGAEAAKREHYAQEQKKWQEMYPDPDDQADMPFAEFARWDVVKMPILT